MYLRIGVCICMIVSIIVISFIGYEGLDVRIPVDGGVLYGKLMDKNNDLIVIMVAGSGATDHNGNSDWLDGDNDMFLHLAKELSDKGISSFRYDKRSAGISKETFDSTKEIEFDDFVRDLNTVIEYFYTLKYEKVVLLGHSQGALVSMISAMEHPVDGLVSISGSGYSIEDTMLSQYNQKPEIYAGQISVIERLKNGEIVKGGEDIDPFLSDKNQKFLLSWMKYNPSKVIKTLSTPILIIQGTSDLQVNKEDAFELLNNAEYSSLLLIENMNHVLKLVNGESENLKSYTDSSFELHPELIKSISAFVTQTIEKEKIEEKL